MAMRLPDLGYLNTFWTWWMTGLRDLIPESLRQKLFRPKDKILVVLNASEVRFIKFGVDETDPMEVHQFRETDVESRNKTLVWLEREVTAGAQTVLLRPGNTTISKVITLPLAAAENLREAISFEMERQTPFKPEQVYFDFEILERDEASGRLKIKLMLTPRTTIDETLEKLSQWGILVKALGFSTEENKRYQHSELKLAANGNEQKSGDNMTSFALAALLAILVCAAIMFPLQQKKQYLKVLQEGIKETMEAAEQAMAIRNEVNQIGMGSEYIGKRRADTPLMLETLTLATRLIPDNAWLMSIQLNGKQFNLQGEADSATQLIERLEGSDHFTAANFTSPIKQNARTGKEQFNLTTEISGYPAP